MEPSVLLNFYLGFSLLFDTARTRTLWLQQYNRTIAIIFTAIVAVKTVLLVLEVWEKRKVLRPEYKGYPPESTSGIFNKFFFYWLNSLLRTGHRKLLGVDDLFVLDKFLAADYIGTTLQAAWEKGFSPRIIAHRIRLR